MKKKIRFPFMENMKYAYRLFMTQNFSWLKIKTIFMGREGRNNLREQVAKRLLERGRHAGRIVYDRVDDELSDILEIKEIELAGKKCFIYPTD